MNCQHCGVSLGAALSRSDGIYWCANCVNEESNLLNSLNIETMKGHPVYYSPTSTEGRYEGNLGRWVQSGNQAKIKDIPTKEQNQ